MRQKASDIKGIFETAYVVWILMEVKLEGVDWLKVAQGREQCLSPLNKARMI
jgi:hypothetical protein